MSVANPTRDDFASLLEESFSDGHSGEGQVVKGVITAIEKDMAIIDVGLKVEGRVPLKEFGAKAKDGQLQAVRVGFRAGEKPAGLAALEILDSFGQRSMLSFSKVEVNPALPKDTFQFKPPKGADVIRQ